MKRDFAISSHAANDDRAQWEFVRDSKLPRGAFAPDPMDIFIRYRGWAVVALIVALILAGLTQADLPNM